jgi:hypothetical protein
MRQLKRLFQNQQYVVQATTKSACVKNWLARRTKYTSFRIGPFNILPALLSLSTEKTLPQA